MGVSFPPKIFSALRAWVWSENKGGTGPSGPSPGSATVPSPTYSCTVLTPTSKKGPRRQNQPPFTRLESKICKKLGWPLNLATCKGRQARKRHSIKWTLLASEFIALQEPITCYLMKNNSTAITSSWSTLPVCHCRRANPSLGTVLIINVGNFSGVEIKTFILNFRNWTGKSSCFQSSSVFERQTVFR